MTQFGVVIVTHGLLPVMLRMTIAAWRAEVFNVELVVVLPPEHRALVPQHDRTRVITRSTHYTVYGDALQEGLDALKSPYALIGADDILPLSGWHPPPLLEPGTIRCVPMTWLGTPQPYQRFGWLRIERDENGGLHSRPQAPTEHAPETYIAGGSQLWSPEARAAVSYAGRPYHSFDDFFVCAEAEAKGYRLVPYTDTDPLLIHMDGGPHAKWGGAP